MSSLIRFKQRKFFSLKLILQGCLLKATVPVIEHIISYSMILFLSLKIVLYTEKFQCGYPRDHTEMYALGSIHDTRAVSLVPTERPFHSLLSLSFRISEDR